MNNADRLKILNNSGRSVFSAQNIRTLWQSSANNTKVALKRMAQKGLLIKIAKGYYALLKDFNIYELANLVVSPSYVSLNSALFYRGIAFQPSKEVVSITKFNYERKIQNITLKYYAMKDELFFNLEGINFQNNLSIASPERSVLDTFYFGFLPNIDNFEKLNLSYLKDLAMFYPKTVQKKIKDLLK